MLFHCLKDIRELFTIFFVGYWVEGLDVFV